MSPPPGRPKGEPLRAKREAFPANRPRRLKKQAQVAGQPPTLRLSLQIAADAADLPSRATLRRWIVHALASDADLTVRVVGRAEGRRLNRAYRARDYATNVLTFVYAPAPAVHADIVLCLPVLVAEARAQRKTLRDHLAHLLIHGVLHAQGFDHVSAVDAREMEAQERALLAKLGVSDPYASIPSPAVVAAPRHRNARRKLVQA